MPDKTVTLSFTANEYSSIAEHAEKEGLSVSQYIKSRIIPNEVGEKYSELIQKIKNYKSNAEFCLRDLWDPDEWEKIPKGVKLSIGKYFYKNVTEEKVKNVILKGYGKFGVMYYFKK